MKIICCEECSRSMYMEDLNKWLCMIRDDAYSYMKSTDFCSDGAIGLSDFYEGLVPYDLTNERRN